MVISDKRSRFAEPWTNVAPLGLEKCWSGFETTIGCNCPNFRGEKECSDFQFVAWFSAVAPLAPIQFGFPLIYY